MAESGAVSSSNQLGYDSDDVALFTEPLPKARRARGMTAEKLAARIARGHGIGSGATYLPWLTLRRKNPSPASNQVISWMPPLRRTAHYFSRGEYHTALLLLWLGVKDLREQFPIWPIAHPHPLETQSETRNGSRPWSKGLAAIAREAGIKHGTEFGTRVPYVASLDLVATTHHGTGSALTIFSSKPIDTPDDTVKWRTRERLELERRYSVEINARYYVSSSALISVLTAGQLENWLDASTLQSTPQLRPISAQFAALIEDHGQLSIVEAVTRAAAGCSLQLDEAWFLFRHCCWTQAIDIDPTVRIHHSHPVRPGGRALRDALRRRLFGESW
ncbi:TnsA endonuclease N-terminal domain-containing protein [Massilia genomosp. 1]|uniref:Transposase n=1 Tax=Massilia genomosp. 1 TaxID=2609280 RepID=A0ABX0MQZ8_9BURK|nr:TnsA endonuclease N-terminal domain-containing protein [Massilia genomosp. 1]NHZ62360.1 hypothetical protein [Massilia genomosp. 1]